MKKYVWIALALAAGTAFAATETPEDIIPVTAKAQNRTTETQCSENNNVNIPLSAEVKSFLIEAIHPTYEYKEDNCQPNFENCPEPPPSHAFEPGVFKLYDDFETVVEAVRDVAWWQPKGMRVTVDGGGVANDVHYFRIYRKTEKRDSWPQFFVLYSDGNLRLAPQPPPGVSNTCFGSSIIIGPADANDRPFAEIESVKYFPDTDSMKIEYRTGGSAIISILELNSRVARLRVEANYDTSAFPFVAFRSMYVKDGVSDVDQIWWKTEDGKTKNKAVLDFRKGEGVEWVFYRRAQSIHNTSGPNIRIKTE